MPRSLKVAPLEMKAWEHFRFALTGHTLVQEEGRLGHCLLLCLLSCRSMRVAQCACESYVVVLHFETRSHLQFNSYDHDHRIAFCACYAMNTWNTQNFPFLTQLLYYQNGKNVFGYPQLRLMSRL
jgi:hypothetical protein